MSNDPPVRYRIVPSNPSGHLFTVTCTVEDPDPEGQRFRLPTWIPGSYMIREFSKNIVRMEARSAAGEVSLASLDKCTWQAAPCSGPLTVTCDVYAWDLSVRMAHLDTTHAYFNGTSVFLDAVGKSEREHVVDIQPPKGDDYAAWKVATTLPRAQAEEEGFGTYTAESYDALIDHPVECGTFDSVSFDACGVPHKVVITGKHRCDMPRLIKDLTAICTTHIQMFGEPPPMDHYLFQVMAVGSGYGGLEHRSSTSLICQREDLPQKGIQKVTDNYRKFLGLCSHEYFHTWNVKRIKPASFVPFDLSKEGYTSLLWAFEGITSYYDDLGLLRSERIPVESYLDLLGQTATRVYSGTGRFGQSVSDSSFDAWTKFYRQDENAPNAIVSYYTKGALIALALDLNLRLGTGGATTLDDVMRRLWSDWCATGEGVDEGGIERAAQEVSGLDLSGFFDTAVRGTEDLDLGTLLASFGVTLTLRPKAHEEDVGGKAISKKEPPLLERGYLGARVRKVGGDVRIRVVESGSPAQEAGLSAGDVIVACEGLRVTGPKFLKTIQTYPPGTELNLVGFRRDELMRFKVTLGEPPLTHAFLTIDPEATETACARRVAWLGV